MIIECQACHARFRLDESRIKGRGARVKCRKCGGSIVVLKESAPPPPPPSDDDGFFDLGSAVRASAGERPGSAPPSGNLIPFPGPPRTPESAAREPAFPARGGAEAGKDEVDLAFDRVLFAGSEASPPSVGGTTEDGTASAEGSGPVEHEAPAVTDPRPEIDLGGLTLDFEPEEKLDLPPVAEFEPPIGEPSAVEPSPEFHGEGGFLISDADALDFLQEKHREAGSEPTAVVGDISMAILSAPVDEADPSPRAPDASPAPPADWVPPVPGEMSIEGNVNPPAEPAVDVPPRREEEPAPAPAVEVRERRGAPEPESPRPRSSAGPAVAVALAVLLATGGYLGLTTSGRRLLVRAVPGAAALWGGNPSATAAPKYDLRNVIGYYESGGASPRILVIKGQVANLSKVEKSGIRVHAALLDNTDAVLARQAVYAGNVLSGEAIRKGGRDALLKNLGNRFGEGLANMSVAPGKAIPFMVLFFDAPANMDSYRLEAKDGE